MIRPVSRPRVLSVRRAHAHKVSPGDEVVVRLEPGLLALLGLRDEEGRALGAGFAPEWWLGLGAAATAATRAGEEARGWTGVSFSVRWTRAATAAETLLATSVIERALPRRFGKSALVHRYEVKSEATDEVLATGTIVLATSALDQTAAASAPPAVPPEGPPPVVTPAPARPGWRARLFGGRIETTVPWVAWVAVPARLDLGATASIEVKVTNPGAQPEDVEALLEPPFGYGLDCAWKDAPRARLAAGESARIRGTVKALRADEVNLGRPWPLTCIVKAGGRERARIAAPIAVADPEPARIFYVLTEDCETFDGGETTGSYGAARALGNANGFMDPEEYRIQMIEKPGALNRIAEKHGARWTHFWTTTQLSAARWAAARSKTGAWDKVVSALEASVREGSARHEYAPHIHFGFEPESALPPQPRLRYDPATDGLLPEEYYDPAKNPDHKFHGWDGARKGIANVKEEGDLTRPDTKAGSLRAATRMLARLAAEAGAGPALITRTGACDFGSAPADLEASFRALEANGLLADADAGLYAHAGEHPRGRQAYFCKRSDLEQEIDDLREARAVQLRAPEHQLEAGSVDALNAWLARRVAQSEGAGVRVIVAMTHAMFMKGAPDPFRSLEGGDFETLDRHLEHVRRAHPGIAFATASEAVVEFLDYYTPELRAVTLRPRFRSADGRRLVYPIRILGRGIPVSPARPMTVTVTAPAAFDAGEIASLTVLERGTAIASASPDEKALTRVAFTATGTAGYELEVVLTGAEGSAGEETADGPAPDLFRLPAPELVASEVAREGTPSVGDRWEWALPVEPFLLLAHPIAGATEPLGRRIHPYGFYPLGVALRAALGVCGGTPVAADIRWRQPISGRSRFRLDARVASVDSAHLVVDSRFYEGGASCAEMRITIAR